MGDEGARYGIEELAEAGGVSRRTVRYYVQEGLLPPPLGAGRGAYYGPEHLRQLESVKSMQEQGMTLEEVRRALSGHRAAQPAKGLIRRTLGAPLAVPPILPTPRTPEPWMPTLPGPSQWTRQEVLPGVEIHVAGRYQPLSPWQLSELAEWCRRHLVRVSETEDPEPWER